MTTHSEWGAGQRFLARVFDYLGPRGIKVALIAVFPVLLMGLALNCWVHHVARHMSAADPTGLADLSFICLREQAFKWPEKENYYLLNYPDGYGYNSSYRPRPDWMLSAERFDAGVTW